MSRATTSQASKPPLDKMGSHGQAPEKRKGKVGLAGIRRPPPLDTSTSTTGPTPPRWASRTPSRRSTPLHSSQAYASDPHRGGESGVYRTALRWCLEFVFLFVVPSCSSWFCCVCIPVVLPFGFVTFASPPAFLEAAIANWTLRQVVFYAVWWVVGPVWVTTWALRSFRAAVEQLRREPPRGLLVASATLPVFLTPWWWGFLW
jgi:hypothetical protein